MHFREETAIGLSMLCFMFTSEGITSLTSSSPVSLEQDEWSTNVKMSFIGIHFPIMLPRLLFAAKNSVISWSSGRHGDNTRLPLWMFTSLSAYLALCEVKQEMV